MSTQSFRSILLLAAVLAGCATDPSSGGAVTIEISQSLTGETTAAGSFALRGALTDDGTTDEVLTFLGPLTQSPVPVTFRRTMVGAKGTLVIAGSASLAFSSPADAALTGDWTVESGTGTYAGMRGSGQLTGAADFGAAPPAATISYAGTLTK
jgi:hypothetical protein